MKNTLLSAIALGALTALALGPADRAEAEPFELNAAQMDSVTGGQFLHVLVILPQTDERGVISQTTMAPFGGSIMIDLDHPPAPGIVIHPPAPGFND